MIKDFYSKLTGTALAFTLLFFGFYNQYFDLADALRSITIFLLVIGFTIISLRTKKVRHLALSMFFLLWIILLMNPVIITNQLAFLEQEDQLKELALLVQNDNNYQKMNIYTSTNQQKQNSADRLFEPQVTYTVDQVKNSTKLNQMKVLLDRLNLTGFQLGHGCITFYYSNKKAIRYYYDKRKPYAGDRKIKANWYWVEYSFYEQEVIYLFSVCAWDHPLGYT